jgi:uncharacterized radical SAM superfamily Fe-S cluster-containing enzyme
MPVVDCNHKYSVDNNPYMNIYVDLTMRCNMDCNYCYNPLRENTDMDPMYFKEVCMRLPHPVYFKFLGGEPTMHPHFFEFIKIAREHGHQVFFASNGFNYTRTKFMSQLVALDEHFVAGLSMDGGTTHETYYKTLNNRACLQTKLKALKSLRSGGVKRVCLSAIITRDLNETVIGELLELADEYSDIVRYIHFRSAAMVGRWATTQPYTQEELIELMHTHFTTSQLTPGCVGEIFCTKEEGGDCCFRFRPTKRLQISLIEFATEKSSRCPKRGKLSMDDFTIQPFFENMINVGEKLSDQYGEVEIGDY